MLHPLNSPVYRPVALALFWLALGFAVTMALLPHPPALPIDSLGDKFEHSLAFATLTLLGTFAFPQTPRWRLAERLSFLGALIEVVQSLPVLHRDCDIRDWIADTLAIIAMTLVIMAARELWRKRVPNAPAFD